MALRNYLLNLVSDFAETNETSPSSMHVTIISDNSVSYLQTDDMCATGNSADVGSASASACEFQDDTSARSARTAATADESATGSSNLPSPVRGIVTPTPGRGRFVDPRRRSHGSQRCGEKRSPRLRSPTVCGRPVVSGRTGHDRLPSLVLE